MGRLVPQPGFASISNLRVAVLGATTADNLGLTEPPSVRPIYIGGLPFQLIGITAAEGRHSTADDQVMIPLSTAHELFVSSDSVPRSA